MKLPICCVIFLTNLLRNRNATYYNDSIVNFSDLLMAIKNILIRECLYTEMVVVGDQKQRSRN